MCGTDIPIEECQLIAHQPTIKEISYVGELKTFTGVQTLLVNKNMLTLGENDLEDITNFQIFMTIMAEKETADKKAAVLDMFQLVFPQSKVMITPRSIVFTNEGSSLMVDENNFEALTKIIGEIFCVNDGPMEQQTFNPANEQAKAIADKIMRGRAKVAAEKGGSTSSAFSQYLSTLSVGLHISLNELKNHTIYQIYDLMERYTLFINWDIDIRARMMGGSSDEHPDNWMKDIHS